MDHILYWNSVALDANKRDFSDVPGGGKPNPEQGGPTLSSRALAIVHLAMYDAHAGASGGMDRYLTSGPSPVGGESVAAAVAAAAHACLSALYPRQRRHFDKAHEDAGLTEPGLEKGQKFGLAVAQAMLNERGSDPGAGDAGYAPSMHHGGHRPDPANPGQGYHAPFYGARSKGFAISKRHELASPPESGSAAYLASLKQVLGKGIAPTLMGTLPDGVEKRTADETLEGIFWAYDGANEIGTPPRLYNQIVRELAKSRGNTVDQNAILFALVNAAMGDAGVLAWDQKYIHNLWRPVLGIREHDKSMGPAASTSKSELEQFCDPNWLPLGAPKSNSTERDFTPNFPAYPSGHATFGAAALHMARLFYGVAKGNRSSDNLFSGKFVSDELNGVTRDSGGNVRPRHSRGFEGGLWQMIEENGWSRIYLGVHWSFDSFALDCDGKPNLDEQVGGVWLGCEIAEDIFRGSDKPPKLSVVQPRV